MPTKNKEKIRTKLSNKRRKLTNESQQQKSALIVTQVKYSPAFIQANKIAFYHAVKGEADPAYLTKVASENTQFYLPVLSPDKNQGLLFAPIDKDTQYKTNQFSIPEPIVKPYELISGKELDLVIMPLLGFDNKGNRLGMGGGYYDRCFSFKKEGNDKPILLGFAYDFQEVDSLTAEPWDIGLDMLASETKLQIF